VDRVVQWSLVAAATVLAGAVAVACAKGKSLSDSDPRSAMAAPQGADCGHTACGANFFVDAAPGGDCVSGATCTVSLRLVATGDFHINEEYPYKFKADDVPGVTYLGTDAAGAGTFSKAANNWQKTGAQTGSMTLSFQSADKGTKNLSGTFKLSVCSAATCQLEQQPVSTAVAIK
jgi:hypothetical protein